MAKDLSGKRLSIDEAIKKINDVIELSPQGETFKGAAPLGQVGEEYPLPRSVAEAQAKEIELRNSGNAKAAGQFAQGFLGTIAQKLIYQTVITGNLGDEMNFIERFRGQNIDYGVAKEYVYTQMSGYEDFDPEQFIPTSTTKPTVITQVNSFLNERGELNADSKAFMKKFTMSIQQYATKEFFLSDVKLQQFVQTMRDSAINGARLWLYNLVMDHIKTSAAAATATPDGQNWTLVNGTAQNMYDSMIEVLTHTHKLIMTGSEYQLVKYDPNNQTQKANNFVRGSSAGNLCWIWSIDNFEKSVRGIAAQTFHQQLWRDMDGIQTSNMYTPYKKINLPNLTNSKANNFPTQTDELWVDNNTIIILEDKAVEFNLVWEKSETQYYTNNMTLQLTYNIAGMINTIKQARGFVYKNTNLGTI